MSVKFSIGFKKVRRRTLDNGYLYENGFSLKGSNGCTVILVHGLTGTPHEMRFLSNSLNKQGYSVICPRLANHGQPLGILKNTRWQDFYQSVRNAYMAIEGKDELVFAAGLSMGALLVLLLAEEFPGRIAAVSCLSPTLFYDGWNTPWYSCFLPILYLTALKHFFYFKEDPPYGVKNEAVRKIIHKYYSQARLDDIEMAAQYGYAYFPVTLLYQLQLCVKALEKKLASVNIPVQLIQARNDDVTSIKNSEFIYNRIKSERKELVLLDNSYHLITADYERSKVAEKLEEFFNNICQEKRLIKQQC